LGQGEIATGRKKWKEETGYDKQSLVETAIWRFTGLFGGHFKSRKLSIKKQHSMLNLLL